MEKVVKILHNPGIKDDLVDFSVSLPEGMEETKISVIVEHNPFSTGTSGYEVCCSISYSKGFRMKDWPLERVSLEAIKEYVKRKIEEISQK